jgi:hypothetical protein
MKSKIKVIVLAAIIFLVILAGIQVFAPNRFITGIFKKSGTLRVESYPKANVFINSSMYGQTPIQVGLNQGVYTVKLVPLGKDHGLIAWSEKVKILENITTYVNRELAETELLSGGEILLLEKSRSEKGQILVSTDPTGLFISLDGEDRGISPLFMDNVNPGEHELGVWGEGFISRSIKINVVESHKLLASFKLKIDEEYKEKKEEQNKKESAKKEAVKFIKILNTPTGWLRVRYEPSLVASEAAKVEPGKEFKLLAEENSWVKIEYETDLEGWVHSDYVEVIDKKSEEEEE